MLGWIMGSPKRKSFDRDRPRGLTDRVVWCAIGELRKFPGNPRQHPEGQIAGLMRSIKRVWTNPILVDETGTILAGHGRLEAAKRLGMAEVPTVTISGLSGSEKQAVVIADNRLPEQAVWDFDLLRGYFRNLISLDFDVELTGFSTGEIDLLIDGSTPATIDPADDISDLPGRPAISQLGDVWDLGRHRLICGDAQSPEAYERLLPGELAEMMVTDPPYNVRIDGHAVGRGNIRHREFPMASGEMSAAAFTAFLERFLRRAIRSSRDGAVHYVFMDWRHLHQLLGAALPLYSEWKNLLVWNKHNAGQGSFYCWRSEISCIFTLLNRGSRATQKPRNLTRR